MKVFNMSTPTATLIECEYLCTKKAAIFLGVSPEYLETARCNGNGPDFIRLSRRIRYPKHCLVSWAEARLVKQNRA